MLLPEPAPAAESGAAEDAGGDGVTVTAGATEGTPVPGDGQPAGADSAGPAGAGAPDGIGPLDRRDELVYRLAG